MIPDCGFPVCYGEKGILMLDIVSDEPVKTIVGLSGGKASNIVPDAAEIVLRGAGKIQDSEWAKASSENGNTRFSAKGTPKHSAHPDCAINAIHEAMAAAESSGLLNEEEARLIRFLIQVNDDYRGTALSINGEDEVSGPTTCVGTMTRLDAEGRVHLHLNIRYCISANGEELAKTIAEVCRNNACHAEKVEDSAPHYFPREEPVVDALMNVFKEITGLEKEPYVMGGGTYARKLPNAIGFGLGGLPKEEDQLFSPGHGGAHQADEGLYLPNFRKALLIFAMGILEADEVVK